MGESHAETQMNLRELFPHASKDFLKLHNLDRVPLSPELERAPRPRPLATPQGQDGHPDRVLVRVVSHRRRLLDEDNLAEKYFVDCCRYAGLISGDSPGQAKIEVCQVKVATKADERTEILITPYHD